MSIPCKADLIFSQYVESNSGTTPKGIEIWNSGPLAVDFTTQQLQIFQGTNGGAPAALAGTLVNTGTLNAGSVMVIGTSDIGTYLTSQGLGSVRFVSFNFSFNGDDALQLRLAGTTVDTFGTPGVDPGAAWTGGGVSTADQNIAIRQGITTGGSAFTDPSVRFETVSTVPVTLPAGLAGFGIAPITAVPEPGSLGLIGLAVGLAILYRRK